MEFPIIANVASELLDFLASFETAPECPPPPPLFGVAVDASKCFDRIRWSEVWSMLTALLVPDSLVRAMGSFYLAHTPYTHIRGDLDICPWNISLGLLQGCSLSVVCTVMLVATWHTSLPDHVMAKSYIDDRLLLSTQLAGLRLAWNNSKEWDTQQGWKVNDDETVTFQAGPKKMAQILPPHPNVNSLVYLGHDVRTNAQPARYTMLKRAQKARATAEKIAQLPLTIAVSTRTAVLATVASPQ